MHRFAAVGAATLLGGGDGLPAAAGLVGAAGAGDGRGLLDGGQGAGLLHALVVLDLLLPALLAAECHLAPARRTQTESNQSCHGHHVSSQEIVKHQSFFF